MTEPFLPGPGERLLSLLFPSRCLLCGEIAPGGAYVCPRCEPLLPKEPLHRELPLSGGKVLPVSAAFRYENGPRQTLHRFKFRDERALCRPLGRFLAASAPAGDWDALTWVPMTPAKKRKRGYDQSELLAREAGRHLALPVLPLAENLRETATQHDLPREERLRNVAGAYGGRREAQGKRILLVDDIVTTGATLAACAQALYAAGAAGVTGLCAASAVYEEVAKEEHL